MWNAGLDKWQAGIKIAWRNINNIRYADDTTLMAESEEKLKSLLMKGKEESEKLVWNAISKKLRSWHLVPSPHGKWRKSGNSSSFYFPGLQNHCGPWPQHESWTIRKAEHQRIDDFWTVVLEKILESPLNFKEIKLVNPEGNQAWIFIRSTDAEAPILLPSDAKSWLIGKDPDAGKDWRQKE